MMLYCYVAYSTLHVQVNLDNIICVTRPVNASCFYSSESGALGSRLTGAGWGGCAVSLVPAESVQSFLAKVTEAFFKVTPERNALLSQSLFATKPGGGAAFYHVE